MIERCLCNSVILNGSVGLSSPTPYADAAYTLVFHSPRIVPASARASLLSTALHDSCATISVALGMSTLVA
jgi:hypothetical protein